MLEFSNFFLFVSALTILEVIWAFGYLSKSNKFIQQSSQTKAVVVEIREVIKNKKKDFEIMVSFRDQNNNEVITEIKQLVMKNFKQGDIVDIFYLNSNPQKIHLNRWDGIYLIPNAFFAMACTTGIYALLAEFILK